jgi:hypothetical protein
LDTPSGAAENRRVETSSDVPDPGAYLPPVPGPEVERYWLPSTRAIAIEWARWARIPSYTGLAVDRATLERVADAVMDPANPPPWAPYTAEERKDELPDHLWDAVHGYLIDHPDVDGTVDVRWRDGKRTFVVGIVGDPEPHRAPLARVAGSRVVVDRRPDRRRTQAELQAVAQRIDADDPQLAAAGLSVLMDWVPGLDEIEVQVTGGSDERFVADLLAARYGDAVSVVWLGPHRYVEPLRTFGSWTSAGRWVRVFFLLDPNGEKPGEARVAEESDERVVIALSGREPVSPFRTLIGGMQPRHADVELHDPVGGRLVIDASAGVPRLSLAQLGRPEPAPRPDVVQVKAAPAPRRRRAQVWFHGTSDDAVYEAMLPVEAPVDEEGDPVVMPAVRRDVLDAIRRDIAESGGWAPYAELKLSWADDVLVVEDDDQVLELAPGPDGLYEVRRLGPAGAPSQWVEVDPPLPDGPIDAETAVDLLSRVRERHPTQDLILERLDLEALHAARARAGDEAVRDALDDEIFERTDGRTVSLFLVFLRRLERDSSEDRGFDAGYLGDFVELAREEILVAVPDAGERILALLRAERDPEARGHLAAALGGLGHAPASPDLIPLVADDPHRHVRLQAARALGMLRAAEAAGALRRALETERGRAEPPPIHERMPIPTGDEAEAALRDALRALTDGPARSSGS